MIDPVSAAGAAGALAEITGSMTGMSMAQAYDQYMTDSYEPYDPDNGLLYGYGNRTRETPAISGDTSNTIYDSAESDPQEAWLDWMHDGGLVDETTGGALIGSNGDTINYSLMEDPNGNPKAVQPVAIERDVAVVAIAKTLGVAMKVSEVDPVFGGKMANALIAAGVVYDKARDLFTCWWDGVNMLFPKKAVQAMEDLFEEEGVGSGGGYISDVTTNLPQPIGLSSWIHTSWGDYTFDHPGIATRSGSNGAVVFLSTTKDEIVTWTSGSSSGTKSISTKFTYNGQVGYYTNFIQPVLSADGPVYNANPDNASKYTVLYGSYIQGGYPEGTEESSAPSYTTSDLVSAGAIAGKRYGEQGITTTPVVPISLPSDPTNTIGDTEDPVGATNPERTKENEKDAPIPLPIPRTKPEDPTVDLVDSTVIPAEKIDELVEDLANTVDPQPPQSTGLIPIPPFMPGIPVDPTDPSAGSSYPTIVPSSGSGFIHVYNPTPAEFVAFGHWLWVTYADATIDKIWNNPFDGILGAHELYATPGVSGSDNIRSGFLVCPTTAALVPNRYTEIDCGTVVVPEFYGNYLDYSPYSQCYIYLPFIGINEVSVDDIVGHAVNIRYRVDSYSGACIAMIYVAKQGYRNLCYQFAGNCSVEVPLAGGSQAAIKAGMMQAEAYGRAAIQSAQIQKTAKIGTGIVQGAHAGAGAGAFNPVAGIVGGLLGGLAGGAAGYIQGAADYGAAKLSAGAMQDAARVANKSSVQHSGQFGASHGAMGLKVPFIMVRNPIQVKVVNYNQDYGFPAHKRVIIGGCTGYLRVKEVNVISAHATNEEKIAIEEALKNGVYVS